MFKTFTAGLILGIAVAATALYFVPVVDQKREASIISVNPNGVNSETFHINVPMDRIMVGAPAAAAAAALPAGMEWPEYQELAGLRTEMFKVRNARDTVIGVASRMATDGDGQPVVVEWVLHFPARGSIYLSLQSEAAENGYRVGELRAGSLEFSEMTGQVLERWVPDPAVGEDAGTGRIELVSSFVGRFDDEAVEEQVL